MVAEVETKREELAALCLRFSQESRAVLPPFFGARCLGWITELAHGYPNALRWLNENLYRG